MLSNKKLLISWTLSKPIRRIIQHSDASPVRRIQATKDHSLFALPIC